MNRIDTLFQHKKNILSVYFTAGFPSLDSVIAIITALEKSGVDMIEIGMPFSDPMADGPVIQNSSSRALKNGMSLKVLFNQLHDIRKKVHIPLLLMGYLNPVLQFGMENFCNHCSKTGIDGIILPDLPLDVYLSEFRQIFENQHLRNIFLISPETTEERIRLIDNSSQGFIYMVSSSSTTGTKSRFSKDQIAYFERIRRMQLKNPVLTGFGISDKEGYKLACNYSAGAIVGSAFVKMLENSAEMESDIEKFVSGIKA